MKSHDTLVIKSLGIQDPGAMASKCGEASPELRDLCEEPWIREGMDTG
jgi:hypothetical protein